MSTNTTSTSTSTITISPGTLTTSSNATIAYANGNATWVERSHLDDVKDYVDFALEVLGIDLTYERFVRMDVAERKAFLREQRINKIID